VSWINAALAIPSLWHHINTVLLLTWAGAVMAWSSVRYVAWLRRWRSASDQQLLGHRRYAAPMVAASGILWGAFGFGLCLTSDPTARTFIALVSAGMACGAAVFYSPYPAAAFSYLAASLIPLAVALLLEGMRETTILAAMVVVYGVALALASRSFNRRLCEIFIAHQENKALVAALSEAKTEAELANRAKSDFLAHMSHELRTPLNAINGFSQLMMGASMGPLAEKYRDYAASINCAGGHLLKIINDVLDLSKIEAGKQEVALDDIGLHAVMEQTCRVVQPLLAAKKMSAELSVDPPALVVRADERKLTQALLNIVSNAIKFSAPESKLHLSAAIDGARAVIVIADHGVGMTPEGLSVALKPFGQASRGMVRSHEGTGLGLPLAKRLIELQGGEFTIDSTVEVGTTVTMALPVGSNPAGLLRVG
jgi:signal transduction histidine kinase